MRIIVDASALGEILLGTERAPVLREFISRSGTSLHVPSLCDVELLSVLRRALRLKALTVERAKQALAHYRALTLTRYGHLALLERILELRDNFSAYDAAYVALAERLRGTLVTGDDRLARAVREYAS